MTIPLRQTSAKKTAHGSDSKLRVLFDHTNEHAICMIDSKGCIQSWNMSAETMFGYPSKEVLGKNYSIFFPKEDARKKVFKNALAVASKKDRNTIEGFRIRKDGSHFWARSFITPVKDSDGRVKSYVLIIQDITSRRLLEQKKEEYIGIASHELKNPITTLSLYSELLAERLELDRDKRNLNMLRDIQGQAARLVTLVDDLLVVSNIEGRKLELHKVAFSPNALLKKIIADFQSGCKTHKIVLIGPKVADVRADKSRISQVIINLLSNAVKYSPGANKVIVLLSRKRGKCVISIQDFGQGISKKDQREIFTRFYRTEFALSGNIAGSGLGLYITKEIMKKHREKLSVKSMLGKGTTFSFTLSLS